MVLLRNLKGRSPTVQELDDKGEADFQDLTPGEYEISAQVDFQDNGPLQSIRRTVNWRPPESAAPARSIAEN